MLWAAERPIAIVGGGGWTRARRRRRSCASPSASTCRSRPRSAAPALVDGDHPNYAGEIGIGPNPKLKARIEAADLVLLIGGRMSEAASQSYTLFAIPEPRQKLVHVHADALEIGRNYHPRLGIVATPPAFCRRARRRCSRRTRFPGAKRRATARADYLAWSDAGAGQSRARCSSARSCCTLRRARPRRDLHHRRRQFRDLGRAASCAFATSISSSGRPRARWASACPPPSPPSALFPERTVVCLRRRRRFPDERAGIRDRRAIRLAVIVIVIDNGMYGTIRMHQEREYPGRDQSRSQLRNPDFAAYARAFGGHGETVEDDRRIPSPPSSARLPRASRRSCM